MFGMYGLAEAVNLRVRKKELSHVTVKKPLQMKWLSHQRTTGGVCRQYPREIWLQKRAMLHAQSGISSDIGTTRARVCRMAMSQIRSPICKLSPASCLLLFRHQRHSDARRNHKRNPQALVQLCLGAFKAGMLNLPPMSAVTIWFALPVIWCSVGSGKISCRRLTYQHHLAGEEAARNTRILERQPRVISHDSRCALVSKIIPFSCVDGPGVVWLCFCRAAICAAKTVTIRDDGTLQ